MDHYEAQRKEMKTNSVNRLLRSFTMPTTNPSAAAAAAASPLTIFYSGKVRIYNAIPPEKAQAIMLIAAAAAAASKVSANGASATSGKAPAVVGPSAAASAAAVGPVLTRSLTLQSSTAGRQAQPQLIPTASSALCQLQAELPMMRRNSLQRFLEKRRDRLASKAPYASAKSSDMEGASQGSPQLT